MTHDEEQGMDEEHPIVNVGNQQQDHHHHHQQQQGHHHQQQDHHHYHHQQQDHHRHQQQHHQQQQDHHRHQQQHHQQQQDHHHHHPHQGMEEEHHPIVSIGNQQQDQLHRQQHHHHSRLVELLARSLHSTLHVWHVSVDHRPKGVGAAVSHSAAGHRSQRPAPPKGHVALYVGDGQHERLVVPIAYLHHPGFQALLHRAHDEFGFRQRGGLVLPCSLSEFQRTLACIRGSASAV
jgi:hypothetical protein